MKKPGQAIRVIVADDQAVIRSGLGVFLNAYPDFKFVGEAVDGEEAVQLCELVHPDVVIMDVRMPNMDGITATRLIHQRWEEIHVLMFGNFRDNDLIESAMEAGAAGYLLKDINAKELAEALYHVTGVHPSKVNIPGPPQSPAIIESHQIKDNAEPTKAVSADEAIPVEGKMLLPRITGSSTNQELQRAGKIQTDILPGNAPHIPGWDLSAKLEPAHETSGDFYDFIPLENNKWGFVIADVSDKGMGAALFMALASTLIRTFAIQYPALPAFALNAVNRRILSDTRGSMYVTAFYGVLEPEIGRLRYVNAGHNPPIVISTQRGKRVDWLPRTGMALGVVEEAAWQQRIVKFIPGDTLILYTDGITEAQNSHGIYYGEHRLLEAAKAKAGCSAVEIQDFLLADVHHFTNQVTRQDDMTLMVVERQK